MFSLSPWWAAAPVALNALRSVARIRLRPQHRPSGESIRFDYPGRSFAEYAARCRERIARARHQAGWHDDDHSIELSSPFKWRPEGAPAGGALLIHGLSDTPFQVRDLARWLVRERGLLVRALLLPGHGTVPGDLLRVRWQEWARATRFGIGTFRGDVRRLYAVGVSTGAALAIDAVLGGEPLDGLILLSPAIGLSPLAGMAAWHRLLSWALPRTAWYETHADRDPVRFESLPQNAVEQVYDLAHHNAERWRVSPLPTPMFCVQSEDDATVSAEAALEFFRSHGHPASRMLLYTRKESDADYVNRVRRVATDETASSIGAPDPAVPRGHGAPPVISHSHLAPPIAPDNPHYGREGGYRFCQHYDADGDRTARDICGDEALFQASPAACYGEKTLAGEGRVLRRLSWNPHFDDMLRELGVFLDRLEAR
jgi:alpha-beta hydrolase superfamily lysophospholipase